MVLIVSPTVILLPFIKLHELRHRFHYLQLHSGSIPVLATLPEWIGINFT